MLKVRFENRFYHSLAQKILFVRLKSAFRDVVCFLGPFMKNKFLFSFFVLFLGVVGRVECSLAKRILNEKKGRLLVEFKKYEHCFELEEKRREEMLCTIGINEKSIIISQRQLFQLRERLALCSSNKVMTEVSLNPSAHSSWRNMVNRVVFLQKCSDKAVSLFNFASEELRKTEKNLNDILDPALFCIKCEIENTDRCIDQEDFLLASVDAEEGEREFCCQNGFFFERGKEIFKGGKEIFTLGRKKNLSDCSPEEIRQIDEALKEMVKGINMMGEHQKCQLKKIEKKLPAVHPYPFFPESLRFDFALYDFEKSFLLNEDNFGKECK